MPVKNTIRHFQEDSTYHIYNRGVAKLPIFLDQQDYRAFLRRLQLLLLPPKEAKQHQHIKAHNRIRIVNVHNKLSLQAYCLMPNHFHMMIRIDNDNHSIIEFMKGLSTSYSMYFNKKYDRVGPIFQGKYKAVHVDSESYLLHLSRYIHCNPRVLGQDIYKYPYSSLQYYYNLAKPSWLKTSKVEGLFTSKNGYYTFVKGLQDLQTEAEQFDI